MYRFGGKKKYAMRLWIDPKKLAAYKLTPLDIKSALDRENVELPTGKIVGDNTELTVKAAGKLKDVAQFNNLIIQDTGGKVTMLS